MDAHIQRLCIAAILTFIAVINTSSVIMLSKILSQLQEIVFLLQQ